MSTARPGGCGEGTDLLRGAPGGLGVRRQAPDLADALPASGPVCLVVAVLGLLRVVPLRRPALTHPAGGPAIAASTAVLLLASSSRYAVDAVERRRQCPRAGAHGAVAA